MLDGENVVFGRVLEGLETIGAVSTVSCASCMREALAGWP